ncbi:MAG: glycosyltransferase family 4 protein [Holophagales bacterium]|nr:MAG: glycosyltransferase family 4 protein [Holophagales bacterium]
MTASPATIGIDARKLGDFGIGTYVQGLLGGISRLDHENRFVVFVRRAGEPHLPPLPSNFEVLRAEAPGYSLRELIGLSWSLRRRPLDLYHATHYSLPAALPSACVVTVHDLIHLLFPEHLPGRVALLYARLMLGRAARLARRVIAVSQATSADLQRELGLAESRIDVVPNGLDAAFLRPVGTSELRARLAALGVATPYLLFLGNPKPHKNLARLLAAYRRLVDRGDEPPRLVLAGARDRELAELAAETVRSGLGERIQILGHVPAADLPALLQGATLFLFPSLYEGFGLPVLEAMATGTAVLAADVPALRELTGGCAHLVDPLDVEALAAGIAHCLGDTPRRESLAARGHERAREFSWELTARRTLAVYARALGRLLPGPAGAVS